MRAALLATVAVIALGFNTAQAEGTSPQGAREDNASQPTTDQHQQGSQSATSKSGQGGKEEPGSNAPSQDTAVFVNGKLNVPGAPADSQTVPAKFSQRNDAIDKTPIMAMPLGLTDAQKKKIADSIKLADKPVQTTRAKPAEELPWTIMIHDLPNAATEDMPDVKYVRTPDRICWCGRLIASWSKRFRTRKNKER